MYTQTIKVSSIVDNGTIVTVLGVDVDTSQKVAIHFDHRPFTNIYEHRLELDKSFTWEEQIIVYHSLEDGTSHIEFPNDEE